MGTIESGSSAEGSSSLSAAGQFGLRRLVPESAQAEAQNARTIAAAARVVRDTIPTVRCRAAASCLRRGSGKRAGGSQ